MQWMKTYLEYDSVSPYTNNQFKVTDVNTV